VVGGWAQRGRRAVGACTHGAPPPQAPLPRTVQQPAQRPTPPSTWALAPLPPAAGASAPPVACRAAPASAPRRRRSRTSWWPARAAACRAARAAPPQPPRPASPAGCLRGQGQGTAPRLGARCPAGTSGPVVAAATRCGSPGHKAAQAARRRRRRPRARPPRTCGRPLWAGRLAPGGGRPRARLGGCGICRGAGRASAAPALAHGAPRRAPPRHPSRQPSWVPARAREPAAPRLTRFAPGGAAAALAAKAGGGGAHGGGGARCGGRRGRGWRRSGRRSSSDLAGSGPARRGAAGALAAPCDRPWLLFGLEQLEQGERRRPAQVGSPLVRPSPLGRRLGGRLSSAGLEGRA
jgi:hypothetical protein